MNCYSCNKNPRSPDSSLCDPCKERTDRERAEREAEALQHFCKSCDAKPGEKCHTGAGLPRCAHAPRERAAMKAMKVKEAAARWSSLHQSRKKAAQ